MSDNIYKDPEELRKESGIDSPVEKRSKVDKLKLESRGLRGNVLQEMTDESTPNVSEESYQLMKHFGMYQQDDRDTRIERKRAGLDKDFSFMVRTKAPGGKLTPEQYLILDDCATKYSKGSIRLTTRQTIQFHGIGKLRLQGLTQDLNTRLLTTYGACGDVVRNTMCCPVIDLDGRSEWRGREVFETLAQQISDRTLPRTNAFYDVFINGDRENGDVPTFTRRSEVEDIYGEVYMPRKFKIGITVPEDNCVDVFTQDLGIVGIFDEGNLRGYNLMVGGGLGHSHSNKATYPRVASPLAFVEPDDIMAAVDAIITIQRDYGNRLDRKQARLKYLLDNVGLEWFHSEMARRMNMDVAGPVEIPESAWGYDDHLGWHEQSQPGLLYVGVFIENGRIIDLPGLPMRSILRKIVEKFRPTVRLTPQQNLVFGNISEKHRDEIQSMLDDAGLSVGNDGKLSELRRHEISCVALPTCGLALAEAERAMPTLIDKLEELGYGNERISMRMSGCPNSCSRAPASEIGLIGCAPGKYNLYVGGDFEGNRLNQVIGERLLFDDLPGTIGQLIDRWKSERNEGEAFGDWTVRVGVETLKV